MGFFSNLFGGPSKDDIIRALIKRRLAEYGVLGDFGRDVNSMNRTALYGTPEATILVIVETYVALKKSGVADSAIFERIEKHRARAGRGQLPQPLSLQSYVAYRIAMEHSHGAPVPDDFIAE